MKIRAKKSIAFLMAVILLLQIVPLEMLEIHATGKRTMELQLMDNGGMVTGTGKVLVTISDNTYSLMQMEDAGFYRYSEPSVSENFLPGNCKVRIELNGYETVEREIFFEVSENSIKGTYDMAPHKYHSITGKVLDSAGKGVGGVLVTAQKDGKTYTAQKATDASGNYEIFLLQGEYTLCCEKEGYVISKQVINVSNAGSLDDIELKRTFGLNVKVEGSSYGEYRVVLVSGNCISDGVYEEDSIVKVAVNPSENGRLTESMEETMVSDVKPGEIEDGSSYYQIFDTTSNWPEDEIYTIFFEDLDRTVIKKDGGKINYIRNCDKATIETEGNKVIVTPTGINYLSNITGDNILTEISRQGAIRVLSLTENEKGSVSLYFEEDTIPPKMTISANNLLKDKVIKDNHYIEQQGGKKYWYISNKEVLYVNVEEKETDIAVVYAEADEKREMEQLDENTFITTVQKDNAVNSQSGNTLTVSANDNAGNNTSDQIQVYYDNNVPKIEDVLVINDANSYIQNKKLFLGGSTAQLQTKIEENYGISKMYYYISKEGKLSDENLERIFQNGEFISQEVNAITTEVTTVDFDIDISNASTNTGNEWYVYVTAEDFAGNRNENHFAYTTFYKDDTAPVIQNLTDVSDYTDADNFKKGNDTVSLNGVFYEEYTPGGLSIYVTKSVGMDDTAYANGAKPNANDDGWISIGNSENAATVYTHILEAVGEEEAARGKEDGTYRVWVYAKDGCGNISEGKPFTYHVDNQKPEVENMVFDVKENGVSSEGRYFRFGNFFRRNTVENKTQTVTIQVKAQDFQNDNVYIDGVQNDIREVRVCYVLASEEEIQNAYMENIGSERNFPKVKTWENADKIEGNTYTFSFEKPENQVFYQLLVVAKDKAGNCTYLIPTQEGFASDKVMADEMAPGLKLTPDAETETPDSIQGEKKWYSKSRNLIYTLDMEDSASGLFEKTITINGKQLSKETYTTENTIKAVLKDTEQIQIQSEHIDKQDGHVAINANLQDNAGNLAYADASIYVDEDEPEITDIVFDTSKKDELAAVPTQYGFFFQNQTKVTVKATDYVGSTTHEGSGVKDFTYYTEDSKGNKSEEMVLTPKKGKNGTYSVSFTIEKGFKGQIYIKVQDQTGQESNYINPKGTVIEDAKEHSTHSYARITLPATNKQDAQGNPLYNKQPGITLKASDTKSGIANLTWKVTTKAEESITGKVSIDASYNDHTETFDAKLQGDEDWQLSKSMDLNLVTGMKKTLTPQPESNAIQMSLKLTDNAGNSDKATKKTYSVDTTPPSVTVEYDNNDAKNEYYYDKPRKATITVTDANFFAEGCHLQIGGGSAAYSEWGHTPGSTCDGKNHAKDCRYTCTVDFSQDGEYTLGFTCSDLAGWEGGYNQTDHFIIDTTNPEIQVNYDNNDVRNQNYYKETRKATIHIEEKNFDPANVKITTTAKQQYGEAVQPSISNWTSGDDTHTAVIDYANDGEYTFTIEYIDLAGNEAESYGEDHFIIDTTEPEIAIEGVADRSANKGEVRPLITCVESNTETMELTLTGANQGTIKPEYDKATAGNKTIYHLADVERKQEKDDIYTLHVALTDLAGNEAEQTILYSVNRFGSVYQYGAETSELLKNYYTKEGQNLVITETNVDTLQKSRITYSLAGEIVTLTEGADYEVAASGGEGSFKEYRYTIYKENFEEEGKYSVIMTSQDAAENQSDNRLKGKEIQFVVDRTAPSIVFSGVEEKGQYEENTREISLNVEDNMGTQTVEVWCDNQMIQSFGTEKIAAGNGTMKANLSSSDDWQELTIVARDMAGNESKTEPVTFLLTTNAWIQWYHNRPLFYLSLAGAVAVVGLAVAGVQMMRRRKRDGADK